MAIVCHSWLLHAFQDGGVAEMINKGVSYGKIKVTIQGQLRQLLIHAPKKEEKEKEKKDLKLPNSLTRKFRNLNGTMKNNFPARICQDKTLGFWKQQ